MVHTDKRRKDAREGMAKLRLKRKKELQTLIAQVEHLEQALNYLKAHPEEQHQAMSPFAYAHRVLARQYYALNSQVKAIKRFNRLFASWAIPQQLYQGYEEIQVPTDATYNMSVEAQPSSPIERKVEDAIKVKLHVGEDGIGTSIRAIECHVQLTIDANFENAAKTWWFDLVESTPMLSSTIVESFEQHIVYVKQEYPQLKYIRMCVAGVFLDHENDRITITQTGIALDKRFPFQDGENRTNGISWIVFQHVTDRLTLVRWSVLNFCPVNAKGALPLREVAQYMRCSLHPNDSDEVILAKIHSETERLFESMCSQFRQRCSRFKLEAITLGSRDFAIESLRDIHLNRAS
ncbi:hypothetical protein AeMF1_017882 [Aphanomyces euteiches]|nr:hypothetical protein AeMF1_017882 [Aphanomyces euteiches]